MEFFFANNGFLFQIKLLDLLFEVYLQGGHFSLQNLLLSQNITNLLLMKFIPKAQK